MRPLLLPVVVAVVLSGCNWCSNSPSPVDPFHGRTRVAPPGTGSVNSSPVDPYYPGTPRSVAPPATYPQQPSGTGAPSSAPGGMNYGPPGGFQYQGSSVPTYGTSASMLPSTRVPPPSFTRRAPKQTPKQAAVSRTVAAKKASESSRDVAKSTAASTASQPAKDQTARGTLAGRQRVIRVLQPAPESVAGVQRSGVPRRAVGPSPGEPRRLSVPSEAIDIMDLPKAEKTDSPAGARSEPAASPFRLVSGVETAPSEVSPAASSEASERSTRQAKYGYDPEYGWVRGRLEYSQIDRLWKVRYIPIDGKTDQYGGSVVLPDPSVLSGCEKGDFVEIRGRLGSEAPKKGYAPTYEVDDLRRLKQ